MKELVLLRIIFNTKARKCKILGGNILVIKEQKQMQNSLYWTKQFVDSVDQHKPGGALCCGDLPWHLAAFHPELHTTFCCWCRHCVTRTYMTVLINTPPGFEELHVTWKLLVLLELTLSTLTISLCQANKWSQSEVGEGSIKPPSLKDDKGKDAIKIDVAKIGQVIDGLVMDNTVLEILWRWMMIWRATLH